jgi:dUTP pyrophosphatase
MQLKFKKLHKDAKIPSYAYKGDAGMDLYVPEVTMIKVGERKTIPLGISMEIPEGYVGLMFDKSSLSHKHGLKTYGNVIDSGYRGEIHVGIMNHSDKDYELKTGDKIIQMLIMPVFQVEILEVNELSESDRSKGGFGSSGLI